MKLLIINEVCGTGSTGKICLGIAKEYEEKGYDVRIAYGRNSYVPEEYKKYAVRIGNSLSVWFHALGTRITDLHGRFSYFATKRFIQWASEYDPDEIWLHNIHGYYINYPLLFRWIKSRPDMQVKWTLHDCWAFTGHCTSFDFLKCAQWEKGCLNCLGKASYPKCIFSNCKNNYSVKKSIFTSLDTKQLSIISPSLWLKELASKSFLGKYEIAVINNDIDRSSCVSLLIIFFSNDSNSKNYYWPVVIALGLIVAFPFLNAFRNTAAPSLSYMLSMIENSLLQGDYDAHQMIISVQRYITKFGYANGRQFIGGLLFFIPRRFWPGKPIGTGAMVISKLNQYYFTNVSAPFVSELFINFGILGVAFGGILIGYLFKKYDFLYWKSNPGLSKYSLIYPGVIFMVFFILRGDFMSSWSYTFAQLVVGNAAFRFVMGKRREE